MIIKTYKQACSFVKGFKHLRTGWLMGYGLPITDENIDKALNELALLNKEGIDFTDVYIKPLEEGDISIEFK